MELTEHLKRLVAALREAGVSCYEGWVPGWPSGTSIKLVLGSLPPPIASATPDVPRMPPPEESPEEREKRLDRAVSGHLSLHGGKGAS